MRTQNKSLKAKTNAGVTFAALDKKIRTRTLKSGVIGLGYVGLPLAVEFARGGVEVYGIDIDKHKVEAVNRGESYIPDVSRESVEEIRKNKKLFATTDFSIIRQLDTVNICVPTPLGKSKDPDISYIVAAAEQIAK